MSSRRAWRPQLDPLVESRRQRYVHSHCYPRDEILMLLAFAKDSASRSDIQHVLEGYKFAMNWLLPESVRPRFGLVGLQGGSTTTRFRTTRR